MITTVGATEQADQPTQPQPSTEPTPEKIEALTRLLEKREQLDPEHRAVVEEMAKQYKIPIAPKGGFTAIRNQLKEGIEGAGSVLKQSALPLLGQIGGMTASQMMSPGNVPLALTMGGAGGVAGTKANEMLGISKPEELDYLLSAMAPGSGLTLMKGGRKLIPGVAAAEQELAVPGMKSIPSLVQGSKQATDQAYQKVKDLGPAQLITPNFNAKVDSLLANENSLAKYGEQAGAIKGRLRKTAETLTSSPQGISFDDVSGLLKRYRERAASAESKGGEQYGLYKSLRQSLFQDMDAAVGQAGPHAQALRVAMGEAKKRIAKEELIDIIDQYGTRMTTELGQTFEVIEPTKILNKLKSVGWDESVGKAEFTKVSQALKELAKIPHPEVGLRSGMGTTGRLLATGAATAAGGMAGGPLGAVGSAAAAATGFAVHDAVARLAMSDKGRAVLVKIFKHNGGRMGERTGAVLQFAASQFQDTPDATSITSQIHKNSAPQKVPQGIPTPSQEALQPPTIEPSDVGNAAKLGLAGVKGLGLTAGALMGSFKITSPHHGTYYAATKEAAEKIVQDMRANSLSSNFDNARIRPKIIDLNDSAYLAKEKARLIKKYGEKEYKELFEDAR